MPISTKKEKMPQTQPASQSGVADVAGRKNPADAHTSVQRLVFSAFIIALYAVIMYCTQSFAFGAYQIRIATALYAMAYLCPYLIVPLGLSNLLCNLLFGGLGIIDVIGGGLVGILTASLAYLVRRLGLNEWLVALPILLVPGLGVASWLSYLLGVPYPALALSLCIGQAVPAVVGVLLIKALKSRLAVLRGPFSGLFDYRR